MAMSPVVNFLNVRVEFKVVECHLSNLRKGCVALSNLRVEGPYMIEKGVHNSCLHTRIEEIDLKLI